MQEIDYAIAVENNHCLHTPTKKGYKYDEYMKAIRDDKIAVMANRYIKSHSKKILRNKLKNLIPQKIFNFVRKCKYSKSK